MADSLARQFSALGDKTRYAIVSSMVKGEGLCVTQLAEQLDMTPAAVSQHMKILASAKVIMPARLGRKVCYELNLKAPTTKALVTLIKQQEDI